MTPESPGIPAELRLSLPGSDPCSQQLQGALNAATQDRKLILQLIVSLVSGGGIHEAEAHAHAIRDPATAVDAWRILSRAHGNAQRWDRALIAIESACHLTPDSLTLRFERAQVLSERGFCRESLRDLEALVREVGDSPAVTCQIARTLDLSGDPGAAEARLDAGVRRWPTEPQIHSQLVRMRWRRGLGEESTALLLGAIADSPADLKLRLVAADLLRNAGQEERALELLKEGLRMAPTSGVLLTSVGVMLDGLDRPIEALAYLRAAVIQAPRSATFKRNLIPTLLHVSAPAEALSLCDELIGQAQDDQLLIAHRTTALRMLGKPEYAVLNDYERLVRAYRLAPAKSFSGIDDFNRAFAREVLQLHGDHRPLDQSLRGGTQTERNLSADNPVFSAFFAMIDAPIRDYIARLHDDDRHPTDRRKTDHYRIAGSWSVRLRPGGFHINHVHPMGWISSAYYIEVPDALADAASRAGWLRFGEPGAPVSGCEADHFVRPEPGMLVLFPSYMWHGTVMFAGSRHRLTAAFDVVPA